MASNTTELLAGHTFTARDLWGPDGRPGPDDVQQKRLKDCFLVAAAGALASQSPEKIRSAISYDQENGRFSVRLSKDGEWTSVPVTQEELRDNIASRGGSTFQVGESGTRGAVWPAIYEIGYAKLNWKTWEAGKDKIDGGGNAADALRAITGETPVTLRGEDVEQMGSRGIVEQINRELGNGRRIVMTTNRDPGQGVDGSSPLLDRVSDSIYGVSKIGAMSDGVVGNHAYMVMGARYDEGSGDAMIRLRNTWGHNRNSFKAESQADAEIEVSLDRLMRMDTRSFRKFDIGSLPEQQRELFRAIEARVDGRADEAAIAAAALQASRDGIASASQVRAATVTDDGKLWVAGQVPGYRIMLDTNQPVPTADDSLAALAQEADRLGVERVASPGITQRA